MIRRLLAVLAGLTIAFAAPATAQPAPERIVAVGDLHGDYQAWLAIARDARLIDASNKWAGGKTVLVQTGDVTDRGPDSLKIIRHLQQLDRESRRAGGRVIVLLGNHEAMQVTGDLRYVHPGEYAAFATRQSAGVRDAFFETSKAAISAPYLARDPSMSPKAIKAAWIAETPLGWVEHRLAWSPTGELGRWAASLPAVAKIGSNLFAHGGISANYVLVPLPEINRRARAAILAADQAPDSIINDELGPLWYRGLVTRKPAAAGPRPTFENELSVALRVFGVKRIVVGHTPTLKGVTVSNNGALVQIDTGIAAHYGGPLGWLEILGDRLVPHTATRSAR